MAAVLVATAGLVAPLEVSPIRVEPGQLSLAPAIEVNDLVERLSGLFVVAPGKRSLEALCPLLAATPVLLRPPFVVNRQHRTPQAATPPPAAWPG